MSKLVVCGLHPQPKNWPDRYNHGSNAHVPKDEGHLNSWVDQVIKKNNND